VSHEPPHARLEEEVLTVLDPDGLKLELVAWEGMAERPCWSGGPVPEAGAIRGLAGITLTEWNPRQTAELMIGVLGFRQVAESGDRWRFAARGEGADAGNVEPGGQAEQAGSAGPTEQAGSARPLEQAASAGPVEQAGAAEPAGWVDVLGAPAAARGQIAAGTVHHVAWRTAGDAEQAAWREELLARGLHVSPILDRRYFHSIYFREPGGVLFEIATDPPGMTADEPAASLGQDLKLPPWLEPSRAALATALPPLRVPSGAAVAGVGA
jgi:glyoxalase family protein